MPFDLLSLLMAGGDPAPLDQDRLHALRARLSPEPRRLARAGEHVAAIAAVRKETGASLREALAVVKAMEAERTE